MPAVSETEATWAVVSLQPTMTTFKWPASCAPANGTATVVCGVCGTAVVPLHERRRGRHARGGGARRVGVAAGVGGGVRCTNTVAVAGAGNEAGVAERRSRGSADLRESGAAGAGAALDAVVDHRNVVRGGGPREIDLAPARRQGGGEAGRRGRGLRVSGRRGGARRVGVAAGVAVRVGGADAVAVAGPGREAGVVERDAGGGGDLGEAPAADADAAFDAVDGDAHVVGGPCPGEIDLAGVERRRRGLERRRRGGRLGVFDRGDRADGGRVGAQVAGGVGGADAVTVAGPERQAGVGEAGAGGRADLDVVGAVAAADAAFDEVVRHGDVVGGDRPGEIDLGGRRHRGGRGSPARSEPACPAAAVRHCPRGRRPSA